MPRIAAIDEVRPDQVRRKDVPHGPGVTHVDFFRASQNVDGPEATLARFDPGRGSSPHYHVADQFQIVTEGKGKFGRHNVAAYCVHFSRAYTPYGPLRADPEVGWTFLALRTHYGVEAHRLLDQLKHIPNRRPWQITREFVFPSYTPHVSLVHIPDIADERGLFVSTLTMVSNARYRTPDPTNGDGQFVVVLNGSLWHEGSERKALTLVFIEPTERAFEIHAGPRGLQGLVLNFPRPQ